MGFVAEVKDETGDSALKLRGMLKSGDLPFLDINGSIWIFCCVEGDCANAGFKFKSEEMGITI